MLALPNCLQGTIRSHDIAKILTLGGRANRAYVVPIPAMRSIAPNRLPAPVEASIAAVSEMFHFVNMGRWNAYRLTLLGSPICASPSKPSLRK